MAKNIEFKLEDSIPVRGAHTFGRRNPNVLSSENLRDYWAIDKLKVFGFVAYQMVTSGILGGCAVFGLVKYLSSVIDKV